MLVESVLRAKGAGVVTARPDITVGEAARVLARHRIGALVITDVDGTAPQIVGIFSERDIVRGMAEHGEAVFAKPVREFMSTDVLVCAPTDSLEQLMGVMTTRRVRHLPVMDQGALVGIVTIGDVVKSRLEEATMEVDSLRSYVMEAR